MPANFYEPEKIENDLLNEYNQKSFQVRKRIHGDYCEKGGCPTDICCGKALQEEIANLKLGIKPKNYWTLAKANQLKEMQEDRINTDFEIQALRKQLVLTQNINTGEKK